MNATEHLKLHQTGCGFGAIKIDTVPPNLKLYYEFRDSGTDQIGILAFKGVIAFRFHDELRFSGAPEESWDSVAIILDSEWLLEIARVEPPVFSKAERCNHYAIMLSNNGFLEVIAQNVEQLPTRGGLIKR